MGWLNDRWGEKLVSMAIDAVKRVRTVVGGRVEVDVKRYARVEKIPGGEMEDCKVPQRFPTAVFSCGIISVGTSEKENIDEI